MSRHRYEPPEADEPFDFSLVEHGSVWLLTPLTEPARIWAAQNLEQSGPRWGGAYAIEARFVGPIIEGAAESDLTIDWRSA